MSNRHHSNSKRDGLLAEAIQQTDLPALIAEAYPDSRCEPGKAGVFFATWRGNLDTPALSLSLVDKVWLWKDHATGQGGNAFTWLVEIENLSKQEAAHTLLQRAGMPLEAPVRGRKGSADLSGPSTLRPIPPKAFTALSERQRTTDSSSRKIAAMAGRGFSPKLIRHYGITSDEGSDWQDALIPITDPHGVVVQVKRRVHGATQAGQKYRYEHPGHGGPAWCSENAQAAPVLLVVEGELSAIIAHAALQEAGRNEIGVLGVAGANNDFYPGICKNKAVYIYADDDAAGDKAREAWAEKAREDGARSVHICPAHEEDFCEYAGRWSRADLATLLDATLAAAQQVYGALDRLIGRVSVREMIASAERFYNGGVVHPTGIRAIDEDTGGIRQSGLFGIGGLPGMGKSAYLRRVLIEHVRKGGAVKLYSPDQSPAAIYRILASQLSGISVQGARSRIFNNEILARYGSPQAVMKALRATFEQVLELIAPRFVVTEEGEFSEIAKDMENAAQQGVTMFGIDFLQLIEPESSDDRDGATAKRFQKLSHKLGVPIVAAVQLAKYKFPPTRKDGRPVAGDIEGSGAYFQASEMMFMVYNEHIYAKRYLGDLARAHEFRVDDAEIVIRKDKEGDGHMDYPVLWNPSLMTFYDPYNHSVAADRKGLLD